LLRRELLYMMQGEVPTPEHAAAVEKYLISTIDHGSMRRPSPPV